MTYIPNHTPLRSSAPQQQWRLEADATTRKHAAAEAASRRRSQQAQAQAREREQSAAAAAERSAQSQITALCSKLEQQHHAARDALTEFIVREFDALGKELRVDVERQVKRRVAEIEREFETKLAGLRMPRVRGTYGEADIYLQHDICVRNGSSYIARRDNPGPLPGPGWQQICMVGKTGQKGERGYAGERGAQGESGATFIAWKIDAKNYTATPFMTNGKIGPPLYLRELFEQFFNETSQARERE